MEIKNSNILTERIGREKVKDIILNNFISYIIKRGWQKENNSNDNCEADSFIKNDLKIEIDDELNMVLYAHIGDNYHRIGDIGEENSINEISKCSLIEIINNY